MEPDYPHARQIYVGMSGKRKTSSDSDSEKPKKKAAPKKVKTPKKPKDEEKKKKKKPAEPKPLTAERAAAKLINNIYKDILSTPKPGGDADEEKAHKKKLKTKTTLQLMEFQDEWGKTS